MAPNPRLQDKRLQALYDTLPEIDCKGMCYDSCGPIAMSIRERVRAEAALDGRVRASFPLMRCSALTADNRCSIYDVRPLICRLYGLLKGLPCQHGCEPERWLTEEEGRALLLEALHIGGRPDLFNELRLATD